PNRGRTPSDLRRPDQSELVRLGISRQLDLPVSPADAVLSSWIIEPSQGEPNGTILVLHGIRDSKASQLGLGKRLAALGYRAVLVDSRGHGTSTGDWLTYGVVESRDIVQLIDALQSDGTLRAPVAIIGMSYGGATGIMASAIDARIRAVVAVAP